MKRDTPIIRYVGGLSAIGFVVVFFVGAVVSNVATTVNYPRPDAAARDLVAYFGENVGIVRFLALTQLAAAVLLLFATGVLTGLLRRVSRDRPEEADVALLGGALAAVFLMLSGSSIWALSRMQVLAEPDAMPVLHQLAFAAGGVAHVVPLGLFVGAASLVAVRHRLHATWLSVVGIASALLSLASLVTLFVLGPVIALIPLGRFAAFLYLIVAGVLLISGRLGATGSTPAPAGSESDSRTTS